MKLLLIIPFLLIGCASQPQIQPEQKTVRVIWHQVDSPWQHCGHAAQACSLLKNDVLHVWTRKPKPGDDINLQVLLGEEIWKYFEPNKQRTDIALKGDLGHEVWHGFEPDFHPHRWIK